MAEKKNEFAFDKELLSWINKQENDKVKSLLDSKSDLVEACDNSFGTLLHYAVMFRNRVIAQHLIDLGCDVNHLGGYGRTPLMMAASIGERDIANALLEANANMDIINAEGETALQLALRPQHIPICELFLDRLMQSEHASPEEIGTKLLAVGCTLYRASNMSGGADIIPILNYMLRQGIDINSKDRYYNERAALHAAVERGNLQLIEWLVKEGADIEQFDNNEQNALTYATFNIANPRCKFVIQLLLKLGANPNATAPDYFVKGPLFRLVVERRNTNVVDECIESLLQNGAIPQDSISDLGPTFFDYVFTSGSLVRPNNLVAQLALLEKIGTIDINYSKSVMKCRRQKFQSRLSDLVMYHEDCRDVLNATLLRTFSLFDLLNYNNFNPMRVCARKRALGFELRKACWQRKLVKDYSYYYKTLMVRVEQAITLVKLENKAIRVVCKLINANILAFYKTARIIVGYFNEKELKQLINVYNKNV